MDVINLGIKLKIINNDCRVKIIILRPGIKTKIVIGMKIIFSINIT